MSDRPAVSLRWMFPIRRDVYHELERRVPKDV